MLRAAGMDDAALARPIVAIVNSWSTVTPCNMHLRALADHARRGIEEAGGTAIDFNTIVVTDGIAMGTRGMRASLMSREVIADSAPSSRCAAIRSTASCSWSAATRPSRPRRWRRRGSICRASSSTAARSCRATSRGKAITIQDVFEAVGAHSAGTIGDAELKEVEIAACPGAGACGGQFTANTMALAMSFLGLSPMGLNDIPAVHPGQDRRRPTRPGGSWSRRCAPAATRAA